MINYVYHFDNFTSLYSYAVSWSSFFVLTYLLTSIVVTGPDHMHLVVWPKPSVALVGWSFSDNLPAPTAIWDGRPTYVVNCVRGLLPTHLLAYFDLQVLCFTSSTQCNVDSFNFLKYYKWFFLKNHRFDYDSKFRKHRHFIIHFWKCVLPWFLYEVAIWVELLYLKIPSDTSDTSAQ